MTVWAGRILMFLATAHLVTTTALSHAHLSAFLQGDLWLPEHGLSDLSPELGAYWLTVGSFGLPLLLLGAVVVSTGRAGRTLPPYLGWGLVAWTLAGSLLLEPTPMILVLIPAGMLIAARRRAGDGTAAAPRVRA
ncbi:hypothetical protein GCM10023196_085230 [Actinoallomurus vinaceus]|uniref:Uncharacterized protein n=1 Tax=Actinoallomurus vinaceus TaxID=1080074 RepID=A0ABP8URG1_9ACTN